MYIRGSLKYLLYILIAMITLGCASYKESTPEKTQLSFYKDYFLARCMQKGFDSDSLFLKDPSLSIYNECTDYVLSTSHGKMLDSLVQKTLRSIKPSPVPDYEGGKPIFLKCLDYYNSREFDKEVRKILNSPKLPLK